MRAIDLYAGIGGWSLGLRLAGIDVVGSFEWWQPAIDTHNGNHGGSLKPVDIRKLDPRTDLPPDIEIVVGSPPCTEFSYSNRGGSGDIAEGLKDLVKFLEIVDYVAPRFWALENVPRVADVLRHGFATKGHALYRFRHLKPQIEVVDFSDYGAPQSRRRCIAGNIPFDVLKAWQPHVPSRTLGDVVRALAASDEVTDPVWGVSLPKSKVTETQPEPPLNAEELRMNREAKLYHPVYNNMAFPDPLGIPSRTVTATCTRVSRESIVIEDPGAAGQYRRLTVRERACLQGFPITYQFYARSFSEKAKMVGNAIPPTFTYLVALAIQAANASERIADFRAASASLTLPRKAPRVTPPDGEGRTYPFRRAFRAALPGLRFKSGMRFDLSNSIDDRDVAWRVRFYFGPSTDIRKLELDGSVLQDFWRELQAPEFASFRASLLKAEKELSHSSPTTLQAAWTHKAEGMGPYRVVDLLGELAADLLAILEERAGGNVAAAQAFIRELAATAPGKQPVPGARKLDKYALPILAGVLVGDWFNGLAWHRPERVAA